jgi:hypothetical protein
MRILGAWVLGLAAPIASFAILTPDDYVPSPIQWAILLIPNLIACAVGIATWVDGLYANPKAFRHLLVIVPALVPVVLVLFFLKVTSYLGMA